jgi:hypothetical protein
MVKLLKQDVIIIGAIVKSPKQSMALSGIGFTGLGVGISTVFERFALGTCFRGMEPLHNVMS